MSSSQRSRSRTASLDLARMSHSKTELSIARPFGNGLLWKITCKSMYVRFLWRIKDSTGWLEEFSRSLSHQNYTFCTQKILLVSLRHPRSLGFQLCMPIFHIHLCTVGQFVFTWPKIWNCPQGQTKPNKIFIFINFNPG